LLDRARQIEGRERREAESARRDATTVQNEFNSLPGKTDPASLAATAEARRVLEDATGAAKKETREAQAASKAAQDLATKPGATIDPGAIKTSEGLQELKAEQGRALDEIRAAAQRESAKSKPDKSKPQKY
jgi:hypothetical protein